MKRFLLILTALSVVSIVIPRGQVYAQSTDKKAAPALKKPLQTSPTAAKGWEAEWQKTLEAGRKEGTVVVYGSSFAPAVKQQATVFRNQFGINLDVLAGRGSAFIEKLRTEKTAGIHAVDVVLAGGDSALGIKRVGITEPMEDKLILPEVINPKLWYILDSLPWLDEAKHLFYFFAFAERDIAINTDLVKPGEIQSWQDLLKPQYKGKIVWNDPTIDGMGSNCVSTNLMNKVVDENYYRKMVATQEIVLSRDVRQMAEWLARGKFSVAVSIPGPQTAEMMQAGAHIAYVPLKEGTYLSYGPGIMGVAAKAPHPNAAKVFVNWLLSREGQDFAQRASKNMSARNDLPTEGIVNPESMRVPGEKYFVSANTMEKWVLEGRASYLALAKDIFGPLMGR